MVDNRLEDFIPTNLQNKLITTIERSHYSKAWDHFKHVPLISLKLQRYQKAHGHGLKILGQGVQGAPVSSMTCAKCMASLQFLEAAKPLRAELKPHWNCKIAVGRPSLA